MNNDIYYDVLETLFNLELKAPIYAINIGKTLFEYLKPFSHDLKKCWTNEPGEESYEEELMLFKHLCLFNREYYPEIDPWGMKVFYCNPDIVDIKDIRK